MFPFGRTFDTLARDLLILATGIFVAGALVGAGVMWLVR